MNYEKAYKSQIEKYNHLQELYKAVCLDRDNCMKRIQQLEKEISAEREAEANLINEFQQLTKELNRYKREYHCINREYSSLLKRMINSIEDILT